MNQIVLMAIFLLPSTVFAGLSIDTTPVLPPHEVHPGLYFTADDIPHLQARMDTSPYDGWLDDILSSADADLSRDLASESLSEEERSKGAKACAFAYILTGDQRYLDKSTEALLAMWASPGSNGRRMLEASYHLQSYCEAYDWIHSTLDPVSDSIIRIKLAAEAERFYNDPVLWSPLGYVNNWGVKAASALATVALTIPGFGATPHSPSQWLGRALGRINSILAKITTDDGLWIEGPHYLIYTCGNLIPFLWHYRNVSGVDFFDSLSPLFDFVLKVRLPDGRLPNIEDAYSNIFPHAMVAPAYEGETASHHRWAGENSPGFDTVWWTQDIKEIDLYIIHDASPGTAPPTAESSFFYRDARVAVLRSGWDEMDLCLYLSGAPDYDNTLAGGVHTHPDPLECILYARGTLMLHDAGYGPDGFTDDNRSWYTGPEAHNIILINGSAPRDPTTEITTFLGTDHAALVEMTAAYSGASLSRCVIRLGTEYVIVADHIAAGESKTCDLIFHGRGEISRTDHQVIWASQNSDSQAVELLADLFPKGTSIQVKSGLACFQWQQEETDPYIVSRAEGRDVRFLSMLCPGISADPRPIISDESGESFEAAVAGDDFILFQSDTLTRTVSGVRSNADLTVMRTGGSLSGLWIVKAGSKLIHNDVLVMKSTGRLSIVAEPPTTSDYLLDISSPEEQYGLYLDLPDSLYPGSASLDADSLDVLFKDDGASLEISGDGRLALTLVKGRKGEVVLDGVINILDMVRGVHFIIEIGPPATRHELWAADVNSDGDIDIVDIFGMAYLLFSTPRNRAPGQQESGLLLKGTPHR